MYIKYTDEAGYYGVINAVDAYYCKEDKKFYFGTSVVDGENIEYSIEMDELKGAKSVDELYRNKQLDLSREVAKFVEDDD